MERPIRIQLSRAKGWRMPPNTVKVDRSTRWGNPFTVSACGTAEEAVRQFRAEATSAHKASAYAAHVRSHLAGKNLACWCPLNAPCHADVLLEVANGDQG